MAATMVFAAAALAISGLLASHGVPAASAAQRSSQPATTQNNYTTFMPLGGPVEYLGFGQGLVPTGMVARGDPERIEYPNTSVQNYWLSIHWAGTDKQHGDPFMVKYNCGNGGGLCNDQSSQFQEDYDGNLPAEGGYNYAITTPPGRYAQLRVFDAAFAVNPITYNTSAVMVYDNGATWCASNQFFTGDNIAATTGLNQIPSQSLTTVPAPTSTPGGSDPTPIPGSTISAYACRSHPTFISGAQQLTTTYKLFSPDATPNYYGDDTLVAGSTWNVGPVQYRSTSTNTNYLYPARIYEPNDSLYHLKWVSYNTTGTPANPIHPAGIAGGQLSNNGYSQWRLNVNVNRDAAYSNGGQQVDVPGQNNFSLLAAGSNTAGVTVNALGRMGAYVNVPTGMSDIPFAYVGPEQAGKLAEFSVFDPGDTSRGNTVLQLLHPPDANHPDYYPQTALTITQGVQSDRNRAGEQPVVITNANRYNAKVGISQYGQNRWVTFSYRLEPGYAGGWWRLRYIVDTQATDRITLMAKVLENCATGFADLPQSAIFYDDIATLSCRQVISGIPNPAQPGQLLFQPNATTSRGQFAKIVKRGFGLPSYTPTRPSFSDVAAGSIFYGFIEAAAHAGAINGLAASDCQQLGVAAPCFGPNVAVSRVQAAVIVQRVRQYQAVTVTTPTFSDVPATAFGYTAIQRLNERGIIGGATCAGGGGLCFRPNANMMRGELAKVVRRAADTTP